ncbi:hypothetical protein ACHQM5_007848 [Ranunculus cassubicifolius]
MAVAIDFDCSAGSIVWVRRRNGSWWPGKIVGNQELSALHLMSPRSGTPVKLLGREDASVDWYNLEKSKRVKPFRCGEFDDCIDKAEQSLGIPIKKREKYARREDAILHALELERENVEKKEEKQMNAKSASSKKLSVLKELSVSSKHAGKGNCKIINSKSHLDSSIKEEVIIPVYAQRAKPGKQSSGKEDELQIRGLQDFDPNRKPPVIPLFNHVPSGSQSLERTGAFSSSKSQVTFKRKRSHGGLVEESLSKRRDRRRPLVQVLQTSAMLEAAQNLQFFEDVQGEKEQVGFICRAKRSRCVYLPAEANEGLDHTVELQISPPQFGMDNCNIINRGSLTEENTTSGSARDNAESDSSSSDEETDDDPAFLTDCIEAQPMIVGTSHIIGGIESSSSEEEGYLPRYHSNNQAADMEVSKWKLKGKRNIRSNSYLEGKGNWSNQLTNLRPSVSRFYGSDYLSYGYDEDEEEIEKNPPMHSNSKRMTDGFGYLDIIDSEEEEDDPLWEADIGECYDPIYSGKGKKNSCDLVDVEVKVQASSYQGEHVPLVSLMSRLNGKAIIGHPIQIEVLQEEEEVFLSDFREEATANYAIVAEAPMWQTARRTAMHRIPRPHPCITLTPDDNPPLQLYRRPVERKIQRRPRKKVSSGELSSQKTRTLSSIAIEQRLYGNVSSPGVLIKPENTAVTCIPVKLVFSRLLAEVGKPPSRPTPNHLSVPIQQTQN